MKQRFNIQKFLFAMALLFVNQNLFAQNYNKEVEQYCYGVGNHPLRCHSFSEFGGSVYFGLMMSSVSGEVTNKNYNLGGIDLGLRLTNTWGLTCQPVQFELSAYLDVRCATYVSISDDDEDGSYTLDELPNEPTPTNYAAQLAITPGIKIGKWSIGCGPYIGYCGYKNDYEEIFNDPDVSGLDYGLRIRTAIHFTKVELGLHYDIGLDDHDGDYKKKDLVLSIGYQF